MRSITIRNITSKVFGPSAASRKEAERKAAIQAALNKRFKGLVIYLVLFYGSWQIHPAIATSLFMFVMLAALIECGVLAAAKAMGKG